MEILHKVMEFLSSAEAQAGIIAIVVEFVLRMTKSEKPIGILHGVASVLQTVGAVCAKAASLLDKILPQKLASK